jgi:hypothetical protein
MKHPYLSSSTIYVVCKCMEDRVVDENKINTVSETVEIPHLHVLQHPMAEMLLEVTEIHIFTYTAGYFSKL